MDEMIDEAAEELVRLCQEIDLCDEATIVAILRNQLKPLIDLGNDLAGWGAKFRNKWPNVRFDYVEVQVTTKVWDAFQEAVAK